MVCLFVVLLESFVGVLPANEQSVAPLSSKPILWEKRIAGKYFDP